MAEGSLENGKVSEVGKENNQNFVSQGNDFE